MAIFGRKKEETKEKKVPKTADKGGQAKPAIKGGAESTNVSSLDEVVRHPRITEKGTGLVEDNNAYIFDVKTDASKPEIAKAIEKIYKVKPVKIRTVKVPRKQVTMKGNNKAYKPGGKKAYVFLKDGDSIEFV